MNVADLSRKLKVTNNELLEKLPQLGFDIGKRAIKIDDRLANKIIEAWKVNDRKEQEKAKLEEIRGSALPGDEGAVAKEVVEIAIPQVITVREFASKINLPVNKVLVSLMKNGVLASMNERIDFDTASIIGEELGFKIIVGTEDGNGVDDANSQQKLKDILCEKGDDCLQRPPVIVVMGHVDHGKTKILDAIRKTDVVSGESGGITQHIGAYQVRKNGRLLTFIDTPGHEAFTAMRSRGARVADVAILVVAADDGVQPQTKEAIKIIQDAKLPFVVAINKIDKPEANIEKVKQDLSSLGLLPEDWGGEVVCAPVSAKVGTGIDDLLDTVLLVSDLDKDNLMVKYDRLAIGTIVESHVDKGEGPVATILIQAGTLRVGDNLVVGNSLYGKVRALKDYKGDVVSEALPGTPVKIVGLKLSPEVGSVMEVASDLKNLNRDIKKQKNVQEKDISVLSSGSEEQQERQRSINLIIKADVLGSLEAIIESLSKLETADVKVKVIGKGLGIITEADVLKAETAGAKIIGFHVKPLVNVANLARDKKVEVKFYEVIYHLIEDIQKDIEVAAYKEVAKKLMGKLEVIKIFRKESSSMILGGRVLEGDIIITNLAVVIRHGEAIGLGKVSRLECFRKSVDKVFSGQECGINFEGKVSLELGDIVEFYQEGEK